MERSRGWSVLGNDLRFSFEDNKDGLSVSGEGSPIYRASCKTIGMGMRVP
jgi:hypothetical protein